MMANFLTRPQVLSIVRATKISVALGSKEIDGLYQDLNHALSRIGILSRLKGVDPTQAGRGIRALKQDLLKLKIHSQPAYIKPLLASLVFKLCIKKGSTSTSHFRDCIEFVDDLFREIDLALLTLVNTNPNDIQCVIPDLKTDDLIGSMLPKIFCAVFKRNCGNSHKGPGTRFIKAVLCEAGIKNARGGAYGTAGIVKCRTRAPRKTAAVAGRRK